MKTLFVLFWLLLPVHSYAQDAPRMAKARDPEVTAKRDAYDGCLGPMRADGKAQRLTHQQFLKLLQSKCTTEASELRAALTLWSKRHNLTQGPHVHERTAALGVNGVLFHHYHRYSDSDAFSPRKASKQSR
jgi:hypothetical protein